MFGLQARAPAAAMTAASGHPALMKHPPRTSRSRRGHHPQVLLLRCTTLPGGGPTLLGARSSQSPPSPDVLSESSLHARSLLGAGRRIVRRSSSEGKLHIISEGLSRIVRSCYSGLFKLTHRRIPNRGIWHLGVRPEPVWPSRPLLNSIWREILC